jgi:ParB family transcriptional regulator, chromosome partitioning protein
VLQIDIDRLKANPLQPRRKFSDSGMEELVRSIKEHGIIQPLLASYRDGQFELIAGERRLRAAKAAGLKKVPVVIRDADKKQKLEVALIENIQREDLNPIELAGAYKRLIDEFSLTQEEVSRQVGRSRPSVTNVLRFLNLPEEIQLALIDGKITEGHAKYLAGLDSEEKQMNLYRKILHNNLSVRDTDQATRRMGGTKAARIKINYADKDKEFAFREFFGTKVEIRRRGKGGQVIIDFFSDEELKEMEEKLKRGRN